MLYGVASGDFALYGSAGTVPGTFTQTAFEVDDLDTVVAELKRRGVLFEEVDLPGLRTTDGIAEVEGNTRARVARENAPPEFGDSEAICDRWRAAAENASAFATPPLLRSRELGTLAETQSAPAVDDLRERRRLACRRLLRPGEAGARWLSRSTRRLPPIRAAARH